jgi:hypothetical protein
MKQLDISCTNIVSTSVKRRTSMELILVLKYLFKEYQLKEVPFN